LQEFADVKKGGTPADPALHHAVDLNTKEPTRETVKGHHDSICSPSTNVDIDMSDFLT
jgi:hypothetical protein